MVCQLKVPFHKRYSSLSRADRDTHIHDTKKLLESETLTQVTDSEKSYLNGTLLRETKMTVSNGPWEFPYGHTDHNTVPPCLSILSQKGKSNTHPCANAAVAIVAAARRENFMEGNGYLEGCDVVGERGITDDEGCICRTEQNKEKEQDGALD